MFTCIPGTPRAFIQRSITWFSAFATLDSKASWADFGEGEWNQIIVDAVVTELRAPNTGLRTVLKRLRGRAT